MNVATATIAEAPSAEIWYTNHLMPYVESIPPNLKNAFYCEMRNLWQKPETAISSAYATSSTDERVQKIITRSLVRKILSNLDYLYNLGWFDISPLGVITIKREPNKITMTYPPKIDQRIKEEIHRLTKRVSATRTILELLLENIGRTLEIEEIYQRTGIEKRKIQYAKNALLERRLPFAITAGNYDGKRVLGLSISLEQLIDLEDGIVIETRRSIRKRALAELSAKCSSKTLERICLAIAEDKQGLTYKQIIAMFDVEDSRGELIAKLSELFENIKNSRLEISKSPIGETIFKITPITQ